MQTKPTKTNQTKQLPTPHFFLFLVRVWGAQVYHTDKSIH